MKKSGYQAFQDGDGRNTNPFNYENDFSNWFRWDIEWEAGKWI
jgi:hypothetical protein